MGRVVIPGFRKIETRGGGEGGTTNYNDLTNKPSINNVPLVGNLNTVDLNLTDATLKEEGVPAESKTVGAKLEEQSTSLLTLKEQLGNHTVKSDVPENAVFTDTVYDDTDIKEEFTKAIDDIVVGGRNLLFDTETMKSWTKGYLLAFEYNQIDYLYKNNAIKLTNVTSYGPVRFQQSKFNDLANRVGKRTFSMWAKTDDPSLGGYLNFTYRIRKNTSKEMNFYLSTEWERYTFSYDVTEDLGNGYQDFVYFKIIGTSPIYICYPKLENGNKATDWTPAPEDTEAEIQAVNNKLTTNLLKPTLATTTQNGVTCINNGDGTYTLKGTNNTSNPIAFGLERVAIKNSGDYRLVGCPNGQSSSTAHMYLANDDSSVTINDIGGGEASYLPVDTYSAVIEIQGNETVNLTFKPMITTNLNATYDDFVPYTGDTGQINSDVAYLLKRIEALESLTNKTDTTTV